MFDDIKYTDEYFKRLDELYSPRIELLPNREIVKFKTVDKLNEYVSANELKEGVDYVDRTILGSSGYDYFLLEEWRKGGKLWVK